MYKTEDSDQLQEMYSNEDSGQLQEMHNTEDPVTHEEGTSSASNLTDSSSVANALAEMVDKSGQLFIVLRRDSLLKKSAFHMEQRGEQNLWLSTPSCESALRWERGNRFKCNG